MLRTHRMIRMMLMKDATDYECAFFFFEKKEKRPMGYQ